MKPFLQGKKSLSGAALRSPHPAGVLRPRTVEATGTGIHGEAGHGASVEVIKQGDKVTRLIVTCTCGEKIEVDCIYPVGS